MSEPTEETKKEADERINRYGSGAGARFLLKANQIFEDLPTSRYILYFVAFLSEICLVLWMAMRLVG